MANTTDTSALVGLTAKLGALAASGQLPVGHEPHSQTASTLVSPAGDIVLQVGSSDGALYDGVGNALLGGFAGAAVAATFGPAASSSSYINVVANPKWARNLHTVALAPTTTASLLLTGSVSGQEGDIIFNGPASGSGSCGVVVAYAPSGAGSSAWLQPAPYKFVAATSSFSIASGSLGSLFITGSAGSVDIAHWKNVAGTIYATVQKGAWA